MSVPLRFLNILNNMNIPTTLRQVIIPTVNDTEENILKLYDIAKEHKCVDKIELLPFHKICQTKYDQMDIEFPFAEIPTPAKEKMEYLKSFVKEYL